MYFNRWMCKIVYKYNETLFCLIKGRNSTICNNMYEHRENFNKKTNPEKHYLYKKSKITKLREEE